MQTTMLQDTAGTLHGCYAPVLFKDVESASFTIAIAVLLACLFVSCSFAVVMLMPWPRNARMSLQQLEICQWFMNPYIIPTLPLHYPLGGPPHPAIVTVRDTKDYSRVLLYSSYTIMYP